MCLWFAVLTNREIFPKQNLFFQAYFVETSLLVARTPSSGRMWTMKEYKTEDLVRIKTSLRRNIRGSLVFDTLVWTLELKINTCAINSSQLDSGENWKLGQTWSACWKMKYSINTPAVGLGLIQGEKGEGWKRRKELLYWSVVDVSTTWKSLPQPSVRVFTAGDFLHTFCCHCRVQTDIE